MVTLLLAGGLSWAQALTVAPQVDVVGGRDLGLRPGLRVGYEPMPAMAIEFLGDHDLESRWDAGLGLTGRAFLGPGDTGEGLYVQGRFVAGFSSGPSAVGHWVAILPGFGGRPVEWLDLSAVTGPDFTRGGVRWRTGLSVGLVLDGDTFKAPVGSGTQRHRPRKIQ